MIGCEGNQLTWVMSNVEMRRSGSIAADIQRKQHKRLGISEKTEIFVPGFSLIISKKVSHYYGIP